MAETEVIQDLYREHNPLEFTSHPQGKQLYWANRLWRSERKGWGQLRPVRKTDSDWPEIQGCLAEAPLDLDIHEDNLIRRGDLVLCVKSMVEVERKQKRNYMKATRNARELTAKRTNPVEAELSAGGGQIDPDRLSALPPEFKSERSVIKSGIVPQKGEGRR